MRGVHAVIALFATFAIVSSGLSTAYDPTPPGASSGLSKAYGPTSPSSVSPSAAPPSIHGLSQNDVRIQPNSPTAEEVPGLRFGRSKPKQLRVLLSSSLLIATLAMTFVAIHCFKTRASKNPWETPPGAQGPTTQPPLTVFSLEYLIFQHVENIGLWEDDANPKTEVHLLFHNDGRPKAISLCGKEGNLNKFGVPEFDPRAAPRIFEAQAEDEQGSKGKGEEDETEELDVGKFGPRRLYWPPLYGFRQEVWHPDLPDPDPFKNKMVMNKGPRPDGELVFGLDGRITGHWQGGKVVPYDSAYQPPTHGFPPAGHQLKARKGVKPTTEAGKNGERIRHLCGKIVGKWTDGIPKYDEEPVWKPLEGRPKPADLDLRSEGNEVYDKKKKPLGCIAGRKLITRYIEYSPGGLHTGPIYTLDGYQLGDATQGIVTFGSGDSEGATGTSSEGADKSE